MLIGIMSDTHGHVARARRAAALFLSHKVQAVLHCGDVGSEAVLVELVSVLQPAHIPVHAVLGNVDHYNTDIAEFPDATGINMMGKFASLEIGGKRIALCHGDDALRLRSTISSHEYDYVFTGHTHERDDSQIGSTRLINPGAVNRTPRPSIALLDLAKDELSYIDLENI